MLVSYLDPSVSLDENSWGVTMTRARRSFHATIIVERIWNSNDKTVNMAVAHLVGPTLCKDIEVVKDCYSGYGKMGIIEVKEKADPTRIRYSSKSKTYCVSREKVEVMWAQIKKEEANQNEHPVPFSIFGRESFITKNREYFEISHPELRELYQENPLKFSYLYDLYVENTSIKTGRWGNPWHVQDITRSSSLLYSPLHYIEFAVAGAQKASEETERLYLKNQTHIKMVSFAFGVYLICSFCSIKLPLQLEEKGRLSSIPSQAFLGMMSKVYSLFFKLFVNSSAPIAQWIIQKKAAQNKHHLELIEKFVKRKFIDPDSCFTWAREKLQLLDIDMGVCKSDRLIAVTGLYI